MKTSIAASSILVCIMCNIALAEVWVDKAGELTVEIAISEEPQYHHEITITDYGDSKYFNYIYDGLSSSSYEEGLYPLLKIGFDTGENKPATDFIMLDTAEALQNRGFSAIRLKSSNSLFTLTAYEYMLMQGVALKMTVSDSEYFFLLNLSKWNECCQQSCETRFE